jgi:hypothetical protein
MSPRALVVVSPRPAVTGLAVRSVHLTPGWRRCGQLRPAHRSPVGIIITSGQSRLKAAGNRSSVSKRDLGRTIDISLETSLVHGGGRPANNGYPRPDAARRSGLEAIACTPWVRQSNHSISPPLARVRPWARERCRSTPTSPRAVTFVPPRRRASRASAAPPARWRDTA